MKIPKCWHQVWVGHFLLTSQGSEGGPSVYAWRNKNSTKQCRHDIQDLYLNVHAKLEKNWMKMFVQRELGENVSFFKWKFCIKIYELPSCQLSKLAWKMMKTRSITLVQREIWAICEKYAVFSKPKNYKNLTKRSLCGQSLMVRLQICVQIFNWNMYNVLCS